MKKLISFISLVIIIGFFLSCDGRDRVHKSPERVLKENKLLDSFSEEVKFFPEKAEKHITDSILSNNFRIQIITTTDMNSSVLKEFKIKNTNYKQYYRDNNSYVIVHYKDQIIFENQINKQFILKHDKSFIDFKSECTLHSVWLDSSTNNEFITIIIDYCAPESNMCNLYELKITKDSAYYIQPIFDELD
jgi:hypothetical protein